MFSGPASNELPLPILAELVEENAVEGCRMWSAWPELELSDESDIVSTITDIPYALFNNVLSSRIDTDIDERIQSVLDLYRSALLPMLWWLGPKTRPTDLDTKLEAFGMTSIGTSIGMVADLDTLDKQTPESTSFQIEEVGDARAFRDWCGVMAPVYEFPDFAQQAWFDMHVSLGFGPQKPWRHFIGRLNDRPVASASLFVGRASVAIANVGTLSTVRRRGIGSALTRHLMHVANQLGARIATLFSSPMAEGIYRSLGFREVCQGKCFLLDPE